MTKTFKVLMLSSWYPTRINPTIGNFNGKFAEAAALYNEVTVIHVAADSSLSKTFEIVKENGLGIAFKAYRFFKYYFKADKLYKKKYGRPDILHLNILYPVGIIALLFKKIPQLYRCFIIFFNFAVLVSRKLILFELSK